MTPVPLDRSLRATEGSAAIPDVKAPGRRGSGKTQVPLRLNIRDCRGLRPRNDTWLWFVAMCSLLVVSTGHAEPLSENQPRFGRVLGAVQVLSNGAVDWVDAR